MIGVMAVLPVSAPSATKAPTDLVDTIASNATMVDAAAANTVVQTQPDTVTPNATASITATPNMVVNTSASNTAQQDTTTPNTMASNAAPHNTATPITMVPNTVAMKVTRPTMAAAARRLLQTSPTVAPRVSPSMAPTDAPYYYWRACTFVDGPRASNAAYGGGDCFDDSGALVTSGTWYGTLAAAETKCAQTDGCTTLHDYGCDGNGWRICRSLLEEGGGPACTKVCATVAPYTPGDPSTAPTSVSMLYVEITSGSCISNGHVPIATASECGSAAAALGWSDATAASWSSSSYPPYCWEYQGSQLYFSDGTSSASCSSSVRCACNMVL
eukprot:gene57795-biopygen43970